MRDVLAASIRQLADQWECADRPIGQGHTPGIPSAQCVSLSAR
jgi:hypothetical protein